MQKRNVSLSLITENGNEMTEYHKNGKFFVEGRKNSKYTIKLTNNTSGRVLAVPTVDGISVLTGKPGNFNSRGYILNPFSSIDIDGWRISDDQVREFIFNTQHKSYAGKTGNNKQNCGVIGVAFFREKYVRPAYTYQEMYPQVFTNTFQGHRTKGLRKGGTPRGWGDAGERRIVHDSYQASSQLFKTSGNLEDMLIGNSLDEIQPTSLGTQMGDKSYSPVRTIEFDKEKSPFQVLDIFYYTRKELKKMGVISSVRKQHVAPQSFPNEYCAEV